MFLKSFKNGREGGVVILEILKVFPETKEEKICVINFMKNENPMKIWGQEYQKGKKIMLIFSKKQNKNKGIIENLNFGVFDTVLDLFLEYDN